MGNMCRGELNLNYVDFGTANDLGMPKIVRFTADSLI